MENSLLEKKKNLKKALILAKKFKGFCSPNPSVGAILVKSNKIISKGAYKKYGNQHAEFDALIKVKNEDIKNSTLFVTLEPCCYKGKNPSCTKIIKEFGISKVIFSYIDPNPKINGKGMNELLKQGIKVEHIPTKEIDNFYYPYKYWLKKKIPFVTAKLAISMDGKISGKNKEKINITGKEANFFTHKKRRESDLIISTYKTINIDNSKLDVRFSLKKRRLAKPIKKNIAILDKNNLVFSKRNIFKTSKNIFIFNHKKSSIHKNIRFIHTPLSKIDKNLDFKFILKFIGKKIGAHDVLIESGRTLVENLLKHKYINRLIIYISTKFLGEKAYSVFKEKNIFNDNKIKSKKWKILKNDVCCKIDFS